MEFDIINDIMYSTVSNLFPNKTMHLNFFIKEEDQFKADIPRSASRKDDFHHNSNNKEIRDFNNPIIYENWKNKESKKRLEEAIKRLNLDESKIKAKSLAAFPTEHLMSEKGKVKNELKKYDNEFTELFNRTPNRAEKEVMRPIYLYYKNLKAALDARGKQSNQAQAPSTIDVAVGGLSVNVQQQVVSNNFVNVKSLGQPSASVTNSNNTTPDSNNPLNINTNPNQAQKIRNQQTQNTSLNNTNQNQSQSDPNTPHLTSNQNLTGFSVTNNTITSTFKSNTGTNFHSNETNKLTLNQNTNLNKEKNNNLKENQNPSNNSKNYYGFQNNSFSNNRELKDKKSESRLAKEEKSSKSKLGSDKELDDLLLGNTIHKEKRSNSHSHTQSQKDKKYSKAELMQLEKEYDAIKKDQIELKQKLHNYQKEFYQQHNRKVKYYKDIIGMENEYQAYKENKQRLRQIIDILEKYRNAN